jgi:hypothetical protein
MKFNLKHVMLASAAVLALSVTSLPALAQSFDAGTILDRGFGNHCTWIKLLSTNTGLVVTYGVPSGDSREPLVLSFLKGASVTVAFSAGGTFTCQGNASTSGAPTPLITYMND